MENGGTIAILTKILETSSSKEIMDVSRQFVCDIFGGSKLREFITSKVCKSFDEIERIKSIDSNDSGTALSLRLRKVFKLVVVFSRNFLHHFLQLRHTVWEQNALFHITTELKLRTEHR